MRYFSLLFCTILVISSSGCRVDLKALGRVGKQAAKPTAKKAIVHAPLAVKPIPGKAIVHVVPIAPQPFVVKRDVHLAPLVVKHVAPNVARVEADENKWMDRAKTAAEWAGKANDAYQDAARRRAEKDRPGGDGQ